MPKINDTLGITQEYTCQQMRIHLPKTGDKKGCCWGYTCLAQQLQSKKKETWEQKYTSQRSRIHLLEIRNTIDKDKR